MEPWQSVLLAIGGNTILVTALGFLCVSLINKFITRDGKRYESELKEKTDAAIENLKNKLTHDVESYKIQLKKSEFFFAKEFAAASEFTAYVRELYPRSSHPDMEWDEALKQLAESFEKIENWLRAFVKNNGVALTTSEREELAHLANWANEGNFHSTDDPQTLQTADQLWEKLVAFENALIDRVRAQSKL